MAVHSVSALPRTTAGLTGWNIFGARRVLELDSIGAGKIYRRLRKKRKATHQEQRGSQNHLARRALVVDAFLTRSMHDSLFYM
mgnify:CR=1 FL=1